jgi:hypothetical protein
MRPRPVKGGPDLVIDEADIRAEEERAGDFMRLPAFIDEGESDGSVSLKMDFWRLEPIILGRNADILGGIRTRGDEIPRGG